MIRVLNIEPAGYADAARAELRAHFDLVEKALDRPALLRELATYDALIVRLAHRIDYEVINAGGRLKAIVTATTGQDHIDVSYAASKGIAVLSLRGETEFLNRVAATAEHSWGLLLALLRHIPQAVDHVRAGGWDRDLFKGNELAGKRLGILGLGRLGRKVARYGLAFGMAVAAFDPYAAEWEPGVERIPDLDHLLHEAQILSLHIPLNAETHHLIDARCLAILPPGAVLINTSRGEIVDESALVTALESGRLAGAALDVIAYERDPQRRQAGPLIAYARNHPNLLITPHIGGATFESMANTELFMARKLVAFFAGQTESS